MIRIGKVMKVDFQKNTGIIRDQQGKDFHFDAEECKDEQLPPLYSTVTFIKNDEFEKSNVACLIHLDQYPRAI